ncbi:hypothetical protein LRD18_12310 [Halorhodospira halochloris]|uniref:hypothetical protein n=1 Tax=Halorhodospira halochloris TaxID=1052 RepID=UPI001EE874BD|nr:hypothetical protein [Halorhodospira halochloris]MCG5531622.1 hypothetical protein [Halorhodospira halochloris]
MTSRSATITAILVGFAIAISGCQALWPAGDAKPELGEQQEIHQTLNAMDPIEYGEYKLDIEFGSKGWIAEREGEYFMGGSLDTSDTSEGMTLTLQQTHQYNEQIGWVELDGRGTELVLEYQEDPQSLSLQ